jgi:tetratricopeptide (TPR) repeat protein
MKKALLFILILITTSVEAQTQQSALYKEGCTCESQGQYGKAIMLLKQANQKYEKEGGKITAANADCLHHLGRCYLSLEKPEGLAYALQAADIRKLLFGEENADYINSLNNTARFYFNAKEYKKAVDIQENVIALCGKLSQKHPNDGMFRMNLGYYYLFINQSGKSDKIFADQLSLMKKQKGEKSIDYAEMLNLLGYFYYSFGNKKQAVKYYEQALHIYPETHPKYEKILDIVGGLYTDLNDTPNIEKYIALIDEYNKKELQKECNDVDCFYNRAKYYADKGEVANAKDSYLKALSLCNKGNISIEKQINIYKDYAYFLYENKDYTQSTYYFGVLSQIIFKSQGNTEVYANTLLSASLINSLANNFTKAVDYASRSADVYKQLQGDMGEGYMKAVFQRGRFLYSLGEYNEAMKDFNNVLKICRITNNHSEILAEVLNKSADVYMKQGKYTEAEANYKESASLFKSLNNDVKYNAVMVALDKCYLRTYDKSDGEKNMSEFDASNDSTISRLLNQCLSSLGSYKILWGEDGLQYANVLQEIGNLYYLKKDFSYSLYYYKNYMRSERAGLSNLFRSVGPSDRQSLWKPQIEDIDQLMVAALDASTSRIDSVSRGFSTIAYDTQLLTKGILLNSSIEFEKILKESGDADLTNKYLQIRSNMDKISMMTKNGALSSDINRLRLQDERLQIDLMRGCADYGDYTKYMTITSEDVKSSLDDMDVAIEFAKIKTGVIELDNEYVAIVLRKNWSNPIIISLINQENLNQLVDKTDLFKSNYLCDSIWGKLTPYIKNAKNIYMSADGDFYRLPIEYLSYNGKSISEQYNIYRLSSTKELVMERPSIKYVNATLLGGIDYDNTLAGKHAVAKVGIRHHYHQKRGGAVSFDPLPNTVPEVNVAASYLKNIKVHTTILTGMKADKPSFLSISGKNINLLHIATHGDFGGDESSDESAMDCSILALSGANCPETSGNDNGILTARDISMMDLRHCDLVVLSACETGMGKVADDGVFGLQRGFKNAGVRTLLMSLHDVDDAATSMMMSQFYKNLTSGKSKRQSFIEAQNFLKSHGYGDSKYWSAFIMLDGLK